MPIGIEQTPPTGPACQHPASHWVNVSQKPLMRKAMPARLNGRQLRILFPLHLDRALVAPSPCRGLSPLFCEKLIWRILKWRREGGTAGEERNIKRAKGDKGKMETLDYIGISVGLGELKKMPRVEIGFGLCLMR